MRVPVVTLFLALSLAATQAPGADNDQPATIEADQVEFDFRTGERTYTGNVVVVQGSLRITGDKMVMQYDQETDQIEKATSWGSPATFKQRPQGKDEDVYGEGQTIVMDQIENTLTLVEDASLTQSGNTATGNEIVYDMTADRMTVRGLEQTREAEGGSSEGGRARVTINPDGGTSVETIEREPEDESTGDGGQSAE